MIDTLSLNCFIVHPVFQQKTGERARQYERDPEVEIAEAEGLARAISLNILSTHTVKINRITPSHLIGEGNRDEIKKHIDEKLPDVVIVNATLSPVQQRNLEREWNVKVIDRTGLILEIFGARAQTKEGKIQVDLAALSYQRSRLVRSWTHLERQRGGGGFMGGPGETQIELDRRMIDDKITRLKKQLVTVRRTSDLGRQNRERTPFPVVALVGYTNAGKSTLFNTMTKANVFAEDLPFATLDPTMRRVKLPNGTMCILSDTVGFIADLPTHLVEAFRATLEQVQYADVICHVRDISSPDTDPQKEDVIKVLSDLGIEYETDDRIMEVLNKIDRVTSDEEPLPRRDVYPVSAITGEGVERLLHAIERKLTAEFEVINVSIPASNGKTMAWIHAHTHILHQKIDDDVINLTLKLSTKNRDRLKNMLGINTDLGDDEALGAL